MVTASTLSNNIHPGLGRGSKADLSVETFCWSPHCQVYIRQQHSVAKESPNSHWSKEEMWCGMKVRREMNTQSWRSSDLWDVVKGKGRAMVENRNILSLWTNLCERPIPLPWAMAGSALIVTMYSIYKQEFLQMGDLWSHFVVWRKQTLEIWSFTRKKHFFSGLHGA